MSEKAFIENFIISFNSKQPLHDWKIWDWQASCIITLDSIHERQGLSSSSCSDHGLVRKLVSARHCISDWGHLRLKNISCCRDSRPYYSFALEPFIFFFPFFFGHNQHIVNFSSEDIDNAQTQRVDCFGMHILLYKLGSQLLTWNIVWSGTILNHGPVKIHGVGKVGLNLWPLDFAIFPWPMICYYLALLVFCLSTIASDIMAIFSGTTGPVSWVLL